MVEISVCGGGQFQGSEADVVESFVVDGEGLVGVLNELMDGKGGVVRLDNGVRNLGGWADREGGHDPVGVFLPDFGDKECSHSGSGTSSE